VFAPRLGMLLPGQLALDVGKERLRSRMSWNVGAFPASVRLDVEGPDDVAPCLGFVGDEFPERGRCH
jgi:hypothetical protein